MGDFSLVAVGQGSDQRPDDVSHIPFSVVLLLSPSRARPAAGGIPQARLEQTSGMYRVFLGNTVLASAPPLAGLSRVPRVIAHDTHHHTHALRCDQQQ